MGVEIGNKVTLEYTGTLDDGTVFDSSQAHGAPLVFIFGKDRLVKGFEDALVGMEVDEEKEFRIEPADAYGDVDPNMVQVIPKSEVGEEQDRIEVGMMLGIELPDGQQIPAKIAGIDEETITLDMNHPLAGKALTFKIKVLEIVKEPE